MTDAELIAAAELLRSRELAPEDALPELETLWQRMHHELKWRAAVLGLYILPGASECKHERWRTYSNSVYCEICAEPAR